MPVVASVPVWVSWMIPRNGRAVKSVRGLSRKRDGRFDTYLVCGYNGRAMVERLWTTAGLSEASGLHPTYVRRLLRDGKLRGVKYGRDWVVEDKVARAWLASREAKSGDVQGTLDFEVD